MSTIVVKNIPEGLLERLKDRAARNHRSMTKEVMHVLAASLGSESSLSAPSEHWSAAADLRSVRMTGVDDIESADGREALRAALIEQPDGTFVNVLGIDDSAFFDTLERIRADARAPDVRRLFDDKP